MCGVQTIPGRAVIGGPLYRISGRMMAVEE